MYPRFKGAAVGLCYLGGMVKIEREANSFAVDLTYEFAGAIIIGDSPMLGRFLG